MKKPLYIIDTDGFRITLKESEHLLREKDDKEFDNFLKSLKDEEKKYFKVVIDSLSQLEEKKNDVC